MDKQAERMVTKSPEYQNIFLKLLLIIAKLYLFHLSHSFSYLCFYLLYNKYCYDVPHCTVLYYTVPYYTTLRCTALYCIILYCDILHYIIHDCTVLYRTILYYIILYYICTVLYYIVLHNTMLYCAMQWLTAYLNLK